MKNRILILTFFFTSSLFFAENKSLSAQMKASYASEFYPGVVRYAEEILKTEKDSLVAFRAAVYEGESLFRMGRIDDSISILQKYSLTGESLNPESIFLNSARFFWLGRGYFQKNQISAAQSAFFSSAAIFKELHESYMPDYYALSMLYGGKCYFISDDFKNCIPLFEYVIANGQKYNRFDYENSVLSLAQSYNTLADAKNAAKCEKMVSSLENAGFDDETKYSLLIFKGESQENQKKFKPAYETYCSVIENAPSHLAAVAMQKAYAVSANHKADVGSEPGKVLLNAEQRLSEYPDLLSEFWTRLAADSFNEKDYQKSLSYFKEAEHNASASQKEIAAVYKAEIAYITAPQKSEGSKNAVSILSEAVISKPLSKSEVILISLARYCSYLKNWKDCENYASKCLKSENSEIQKNAVYYFALSKYENGKISDSVATIEDYKKTHELSDRHILSLYAKSLAKQGKYHEADVIFYSLGEKNQLDNDGRLDYSRTLLIAGHYVSTKEQASKAKGDEAVYLASLASFNQKKWAESESGFSKITTSKTLAKEYVAYAWFYLGYAQYQQGEYSKSVETLNHFVQENPYHQFAWSAHMTSARSAALAKNEAKAIDSAQKAVGTARNETERNEAIILTAGILSDSKKYDEALSLLSPHLNKRTEFGYECKYRSAEILVQKDNFSEADVYFAELAHTKDAKAGLLPEESCYRRAEIAYANEDFATAAELFEKYRRDFAGGRFSFAATYFSADSLAKSGDETRAILRYLQIVESKTETSYRYGAEKNLVDLYAKIGEAENAIAMANRMISEYGDQAKKDGIDKKISEIKSSTVWNANSENEKITSAEKELSKHKNDKRQAESNMKNALFLANAYRTKGENKKSAELYLEAAKYSRIAGNNQNAARSFYGAVESFDAAGLYADSKATYNEMKKLYPDNSYTIDAQKIIEQTN
ncbi:MAG: tetratricopeptide repeat protein [Treponema sp.]|nr:tetratricopeptide repeat protein [Treponema sp.]